MLSLIRGPKAPGGGSQVCPERRRVSLDPGGVHNLWGCDAAAGIHGVWGGKPAAGEGRSSPPGLSDEGLPWPVGGMPAVSRGMMQESPLILSSRPGIETWLSPDHGVLRCEAPPDHPPSPPASSNDSPSASMSPGDPWVPPSLDHQHHRGQTPAI